MRHVQHLKRSFALVWPIIWTVSYISVLVKLHLFKLMNLKPTNWVFANKGVKNYDVLM